MTAQSLPPVYMVPPKLLKQAGAALLPPLPSTTLAAFASPNATRSNPDTSPRPKCAVCLHQSSNKHWSPPSCAWPTSAKPTPSLCSKSWSQADPRKKRGSPRLKSVTCRSQGQVSLNQCWLLARLRSLVSSHRPAACSSSASPAAPHQSRALLYENSSDASHAYTGADARCKCQAERPTRYASA